MSIGKRIKEAREGRGMSMSDLAKALSITPSGVSNWENERFNPRPAMLTRVADALHVERGYLETGEMSKLGEAPAHDPVIDASTVSDVLSEAKADIAAILKLPIEKVAISFNVTL